ncbi:hypothetical protein PAPYR_12637 [Paratrimastix pyriformis]|uniref:Uncharacterized protein n=1 Tax=Paratrimastix pyriformis TaxID=342808 RepID=A0ABQ8U6U2_9EUKA|nr:hypothetical protein PAPYR_12637 [Paratrimastix pyriformis]
MSAVARIVCHLHGLEEIRLLRAGNHDFDLCDFAGPLLAALGRSCPRLRLLHMDLGAIFPGAALQGLAPIAGTLEDVQVPLQISDDACCEEERVNNEAGVAFLQSLASVRKLSLFQCPAEILRPLAPQLTHLGVSSCCCTRAPADEGLCHLERLELPSLCVDSMDGMAALARLLTANTTTLRTVSLQLFLREKTGLSPLLGLLDGLPHLTGLTLILDEVPSRAAVFGALPTGLLDRLEQLNLDLGGQPPRGETHDTIRIASRRLRMLRLDFRFQNWNYLTDAPILELACPRLEALTLPKSVGSAIKELVMECPQLCSIEGLPTSSRNRWTAMPHLVRVRGRCLWGSRKDTSQWCPSLDWPQLLEGSPRLRRLPKLIPGEPAALAQLLEAHSLTRLSLAVSPSALPSLHGTRSGGLRALRLPAQLERLEVTFVFDWRDRDTASPVLRVEAAGLRALTVRLELHGDSLPHRPALSVCCPALVAFDADLFWLRSFALIGQHPPLLNLALSATQSPPSEAVTAGLSDCLQVAAATLRRVSLCGTGFSKWPRLATALGRLSQLAVLHLAGLSADEEVALACPHLRRLCLGGARLPAAGDILFSQTVYATAERFELAGPVPPHRRPQCPTVRFDELAKRFPWLRQLPRTP